MFIIIKLLEIVVEDMTRNLSHNSENIVSKFHIKCYDYFFNKFDQKDEDTTVAKYNDDNKPPGQRPNGLPGTRTTIEFKS